MPAAFKIQETAFKDSLAAALEATVQKMVAAACKEQLKSMDLRLSSLSRVRAIMQDVAAIQKTLATLACCRSVPDLGAATSV